ncbi:metal-sulfur cluster assembly factor [Rhizobium sp. A37_96]
MAEQGSVPLRNTVMDALRTIIDPEIGGNLVDLGLIYGVQETGNGTVEITMTTTVRGCPASGFLREAVRDRARQVAGVGAVEVRLTYEPPWSPDMIRNTEEVRRFS